VTNHWFYVGGHGPGNYTRIQDAINQTADGDTVYVLHDSSPYYETIQITHSIHLLGENPATTTIISPRFYAVYIKADAATLEGFTLFIAHKYPGVYVDSNSTTITNNIIISAGGIEIYFVSNTTISHNTIQGNESGINLCSSDKTRIENNTMMNQDLGVYTFKSPQTVITHNTFNANYQAISLVESIDSQVIGNAISHSLGSGIFFDEAYYNNPIIGNTITGCNEGIYLWVSSTVNIKDNILTNNRCAIDIDQSNYNLITRNTFISNTMNAHFGNCTVNRWLLNYWDRPRLLPYPIRGSTLYGKPWWNLDWRPAFTPPI
jgi:parallel beta-helix repeat protein